MELSLKEKRYIEKTVNSYKEKETSKLDELRALDKKAKKGPTVFAYVFGIIGSLVLGAGMSVAMGVILKELFVVGILVGIVGIALVSVNYPLYKVLLKRSKGKYANQIQTLSSELLNENK